jgi:hypothetical protein
MQTTHDPWTEKVSYFHKEFACEEQNKKKIVA